MQFLRKVGQQLHDTNKLIKNMRETSISFSIYKHDEDQDYYIH